MSEDDQTQQQQAEADPTAEVTEEVNHVEEATETVPSENGANAHTEASQSRQKQKNGRIKQLHTGDEPQHIRLRLLCPLGMAGGLIGKKGESIMKIRRETNTQVAIEDYMTGSEDRVVTIVAERGPSGSEFSNAEEALCNVFDRMCILAAATQHRQVDGKVVAVVGSEVEPQPEVNGHASDAGDSEVSSAATVAATSTPCAARLLVDSSQMGYLVGKGGAAIKNTLAQSGASIQILSKAELPPCACVTDEVVLVTGDQEQVKAALRLLGAQQRRHPPRLQPPGQAGPLLLGHAAHPDLSMYHGIYGAPGAMAHHASQHAVQAMYGGGMSQSVDITFRLLAPVGKTGNIIGRSGEHIKRIRTETGARVKVHDPFGESEERLVTVTSQEEALSPYCAAQDALIRCVISLTSDDLPGATHRVRLLISQASVGVVLGKKGHTVTQLRAETGAVIKVLPSDGVQVDESDPEEVVQVEGNIQQCISALRGVATLLRGWQIRRQTRQRGAVTPSSSPPPGAIIAQPLSLSPQHRTTGVLPPPPPVGSPGMMAYSYSPLPNNLMSPVHHSPMGSPHHSFRYNLSQPQVGAVIGRGGTHITQIRQMSGARVQLPADLDDKGERRLEISGTPEQCSAAHHLVNSYLAMGRAPPAFPL